MFVVFLNARKLLVLYFVTLDLSRDRCVGVLRVCAQMSVGGRVSPVVIHLDYQPEQNPIELHTKTTGVRSKY